MFSLSFRFARRYLFARKTTNAINIISGITVLGITLGTAALVIVLSVFNGFEDLIKGLANALSPDIRVTALKGKVFTPTAAQLTSLRRIEGVKAVSESIEEIAFFEYDKRQDFGRIKGVDAAFDKVAAIRPAVKMGEYTLGRAANSDTLARDDDSDEPQPANRIDAIIGLGMQQKLSIALDDPLSALAVYMPKRGGGGTGLGSGLGMMSAPFKVQYIRPVGVFEIQADLDGQYVLTSLAFARSLLDYHHGEVSSLEIGCTETASVAYVQKEVRRVMGEGFAVKNHYEQDESFYKIMNIERWVGFLLAAFMLLIVAFNMVGSLWMLVLEKRRDIAILRAMGATAALIRAIFLFEGLLMAALGAGAGFAIAVAFILAQQHFGLIALNGNMVVDAYPVSMRIFDFVVVGITVFSIALLAAYLPAHRAAELDTYKEL